MRATRFLLLVALTSAGCTPSNIDAVTTVALREAGVGPTTHMDASSDAHVTPTGTGLHTRGTQIVDKDGNPFVIRAVTWYGLDQDLSPHGLSYLTIDDILQRMKSLRFNTIRMTWSSEMLHTNRMPMSINYTVNPELAGVTTPLALLDTVIDHAEAAGLKIILSRRRASAGAPTALWYDGNYGPQYFLDDWAFLASRYLKRATVIGCDLESDLRGNASWGDGDPGTDWKAAAESAGNEILATNPDVLIFVEGVDTVGDTSYWKGGNLQGVKTAQVKLTLPDRLVYATQDFARSFIDPPKKGAPWFDDTGYPGNLASVWNANWGFVFQQGIAPVFVAAFDAAAMNAEDLVWLQTLTAYIHDNGLGYAYYALDDDSPGGIYSSFATNALNDRVVSTLGPILTP